MTTLRVTNNPILMAPTSEKPNLCKRIALKVWEVTKFIIMTIACCWLYWMNATLFTAGFVIGVLFNDKMEAMLDKVKTIWKKQSVEMASLLGIGLFLSLPVAIATSSVLAGGYLGSTLTKNAFKDK